MERAYYSQRPDADLVDTILQHPGTPLESLCLGVLFYERHQDGLLRVAYTLLHHWQDAEDAVAEGFMKAYRALPQYNSQQPFFPWLFTIVRNVARTKSRRWHRRMIVPSDIVQQHAHQPVYDTLIDLDRAIQRLPRFAQESSRLWFQQGASYAEIGRALRLPVGTVGSQLTRARVQLRREMEILE